jgi:hypothetical protein
LVPDATLASKHAGGERMPLSVKLAIWAIVLNLTVSSNLLYVCGINYEAPGGNPLTKFHPGTYVMFVAFAIMLWDGRRPLHNFSEVLKTGGRPVFFIAMMACAALTGLMANGISGTAVYVENFVPVSMFMVIFQRQGSPAMFRKLAYIMLALFTLNVVISMIETGLHKRLIPIYLMDKLMKEADSEFRGTGLYDHPLTGAAMTMMALIMMFGMDLKPWLRGSLAILLLIGLISFGGRTSLATAVLCLGGWGCSTMVMRALKNELRPRDLAVSVLTVIGVPVLIFIVFTTTGFGQRIIAHMYWDESANTRVIQWQVLSHMTVPEMLFGTTFDRVRNIVFQIGLELPFNDIENFWLLLLVDLGAIGYVFFLVGFLAFLADLWRQLPTSGRMLLIAMLMVASSSNSLGRKSNFLTIAVPGMLAMNAFVKKDEEAVAVAASATTETGRLFSPNAALASRQQASTQPALFALTPSAGQPRLFSGSRRNPPDSIGDPL